MKYLMMLLVFCFPLASVAKDKSALHYQPTLSFAMAQKMASACMEWQEKNKISNLAIAIFNHEARLVYFARMDGVSVGASEVALQKAESAAKFSSSTRETSGWINSNPSVATIDSIVGIVGGLAIKTPSGKSLGGIGVSGAASEDDEKCAQAGVDAVKSELVD